uniref:Uncharacterized protein n=1 Tax=viral metagenome TaxID=1070528 RepID=A0A6H1ZAG5_9ZZZZ
MGIYDTYEGIQLKVGSFGMDNYNLGDEVPIKDGIYVGHEGIVVVIGRKFMAKFNNLTSKWGDEISPAKILHR